MRQHHLTRPIRFLTLLGALIVAGEAGVMQNVYAGSHSTAGPTAEPLVGGLEGGSGSAIGPGGALYVTEAHAGRISRVDPESGRVTTFASDLPKRMPGFPFGGVVDVAFIGKTAYALVTLVGPDVGGNDTVGIYRVNGRSRFTVFADIGRFSIRRPPPIPFECVVPSGAYYTFDPYQGGFLVTDGHLNRVALNGPSDRGSGQATAPPVDQALQFFRNLPVREGPEILRMLRAPTGVSALGRALALADVPSESVVTPNRHERHQLTAMARVLAYHELQDEFAVLAVDARPAVMALYARIVLLVTRPALELLSDPELQATIAHEVGHSYFWWEYKSACERGDVEGLQVVELKCDAVAALTMTALDLNPESLYQAVVKMVRFNGVSGDEWGTNGYPRPEDRRRFVQTLLQSTPRQ